MEHFSQKSNEVTGKKKGAEIRKVEKTQRAPAASGSGGLFEVQ